MNSRWIVGLGLVFAAGVTLPLFNGFLRSHSKSAALESRFLDTQREWAATPQAELTTRTQIAMRLLRETSQDAIRSAEVADWALKQLEPESMAKIGQHDSAQLKPYVQTLVKIYRDRSSPAVSAPVIERLVAQQTRPEVQGWIRETIAQVEPVAKVSAPGGKSPDAAAPARLSPQNEIANLRSDEAPPELKDSAQAAPTMKAAARGPKPEFVKAGPRRVPARERSGYRSGNHVPGGKRMDEDRSVEIEVESGN